MKSATGKEKAKLKPRNEEIVSENGKKKKKVEEEKPDNQGDIPKKKDKTTESTEQKVPHEKDPKEYKSTSTIKEPSKSVNPKSSVAKPPKNEAGESSGDELAWDQDKAEEDALAQQMQQLSLKKARDKRPDDPDMVEWKRVRAWSKDDEVVYFRNPDTGNKQRTVLTAWTEETRKFGKVKKDCLVFYSRKDRRAFYCESFEDEEPKRDT
ncbi:hypothetical protein TARUN_6532 [Trichoderma arundinaceum]|uniref:Uncharacterized protein n=1 Tax=Trichoderma arundinaceum TaxID=490622 RepID=A0A395NIY2_TRIAR|nr:hypothetical protein TARUN_6532 [Trichoderma arundinaceum]